MSLICGIKKLLQNRKKLDRFDNDRPNEKHICSATKHIVDKWNKKDYIPLQQYINTNEMWLKSEKKVTADKTFDIIPIQVKKHLSLSHFETIFTEYCFFLYQNENARFSIM